MSTDLEEVFREFFQIHIGSSKSEKKFRSSQDRNELIIFIFKGLQRLDCSIEVLKKPLSPFC